MIRAIGLFCAVLGLGMSNQIAIPQTPAGRALQAWLEAYNSGDRARVQAFVQKFEPTVSTDSVMAFHDENGRIEFAGIENADENHMTFVARQTGESRAVGKLSVTGHNPPQIQSLNFIGLKRLSSRR